MKWEKNFRKEEAMIKFKIILLIIIGLIAWLFVGIINKSQEYYEPELCLKYPTLQIKLNKPYLSENLEINKLNKETRGEYISYAKNYNLIEKLVYVGAILPFIILQFFLSVLFIKFIAKYSFRVFLFDILLFIISFAFLCFFLTLGFFHYKNIVLYVLGILIFNLILNFFTRNFILIKKSTVIETK
nr:hypothetical protein [uncultured Flavobacterium sp.]